MIEKIRGPFLMKHHGVAAGHLLLWTATSALVSASTDDGSGDSGEEVVYEAKFVEADNFRGFSSNAVYLRLSARYIDLYRSIHCTLHSKKVVLGTPS